MTSGLPSKRGSDRAALGVALAVLGLASTARADVPATNAEAAESLFLEAKALLRDGDAANACPKLAESQRLDPGTGTLLMLALCHERVGRTATAWGEFREALGRAQREDRADREDLARRHIASLEHRVAHVRVVVREEDAALPTFEVKNDGVALTPVAGVATVAVDPGSHVLEAFVKGERLWSLTVAAASDGAEQEVHVPRLGAPPPPLVPDAPRALAITAPVPPPRVEEGHPMRYAAVSAGVIALAGVVVGAVFGQRAIEKSKEAKGLCPAYPCAAGASEANDAAKSAALISNVSFAVGGAGAVGALTFMLLDGGSQSHGNASASSPVPVTAAPRVAGFTLGWQGKW